MAKAKGCRPCKQFSRKYNTIAEHFSDSVFVTCIGDRNDSTRGLMRNMKVRATPTFLSRGGGERAKEYGGIKGEGGGGGWGVGGGGGGGGGGERCIHFEGAILSTEGEE